MALKGVGLSSIGLKPALWVWQEGDWQMVLRVLIFLYQFSKVCLPSRSLWGCELLYIIDLI